MSKRKAMYFCGFNECAHKVHHPDARCWQHRSIGKPIRIPKPTAAGDGEETVFVFPEDGCRIHLSEDGSQMTCSAHSSEEWQVAMALGAEKKCVAEEKETILLSALVTKQPIQDASLTELFAFAKQRFINSWLSTSRDLDSAYRARALADEMTRLGETPQKWTFRTKGAYSLSYRVPLRVASMLLNAGFDFDEFLRWRTALQQILTWGQKTSVYGLQERRGMKEMAFLFRELKQRGCSPEELTKVDEALRAAGKIVAFEDVGMILRMVWGKDGAGWEQRARDASYNSEVKAEIGAMEV